MNIKPINVTHLEHNFDHFKKSTMLVKYQDTRFFSGQMNAFKKQYTKFGMLDVFSEKLADFAENLQQKGQKDFAGIVYSGLAKLPIAKEKRISILEKAITNAEEQGDKFHVLARVVDLKKLYKSEWMSKKYVKTLLKEEKCLKGIVSDFEEAKKGFKTVSKETESEKIYSLRLAFARIDIAKTCMKENPKLALSKIKDAKKVFQTQGRTKEVDFADNLIAQITTRKTRHS